MGREARCAATWGAHSGEVTALLESTELIVRGAFRARAPLDSLTAVHVSGDTLRFRAGEEDVALVLGAAAQRWAAALAKPRPTLAARFGITAQSRLVVEGPVDDEALAAALAVASTPSADGAAMIVARVDDPETLADVATRHHALLARGVPIWVVYTKGRGAPLGEAAVRTILRGRGLMDLKVASVSPVLTALKFARIVAK
jgi:hypothetical protein